MEQEPNMHINYNGTEFDLGRNNATLFTYLGRAALNHVFIHHLSGQGENRGGYIFAGVEQTREAYEQMAEYMSQEQYPMVLNQPEIAQCDEDAFLRAASRDIDNTPDWLPEV